MKIKLLLLFVFVFSTSSYSQLITTVKGEVLDKDNSSVVNTAIVTVLSSSKNIPVSDEGEFVIESWQSPPLDIRISAFGFKDHYYTITSNEEWVTILLEEEVTSLNEVVVAASRTSEKVFESPVSVEILSTKDIENTTAATFYDGLENLKGVNVNTSSIAYKSVNTRGFASIGNNRFVQLVDGLDNASASLNFSVGNLVGLNELDVKSIELLPGASSALYGANAFNGIMFMRSKNPFEDEGVSVYGKTGFTNADNVGLNEFYDVGFRVAKKLNDKIALKLTASYLKATDWLASDESNFNAASGRVVAGTRQTNLRYNGVNVYGDESEFMVSKDGKTLERITRTGYHESDLIDPDTNSFKASFSAHFRPFERNANREITYTSKIGTGNVMYHEARRIALRNFISHQHKVEWKSEHMMFRVYGNFENAGDSYDLNAAAQNILKKSQDAWLTAYRTILFATQSHQEAREAADLKTLNPNSEGFRELFNTVVNNSDLSEGAKFVSNSRYYHSDVNYNFKEKVKFAELQIGGSYRRYVLDSEGSVFTDVDGVIHHNEYGLYTQLQKTFLEDKLKLTGSLRLDKSDGFDANISPRFSVLYNLDEDRNHNIRASFQTGFRNPTTQEQYAGVFLGNAIGLGAAKGNAARYNRTLEIAGSTYEFNGQQAYDNSYTLESIENYQDTIETALSDSNNKKSEEQLGLENAGLLEQSNLDNVAPEGVQTIELGYRGKINANVEVDISGYYSQYSNLIANALVVAPLQGNVADGTAVVPLLSGAFVPISVAVNTNEKVAAYGADFGLKTILFRNYKLGLGYTYTKLDFDESEADGFETNFNTPEHKVKLAFSNSNVYKGIGFGLNARWQDSFLWQSNFVDAYISARTIVDAQVTYEFENLNSKIKLGGANIFGNEYVSAGGAGTVGSQAYISWTSNF